MTSAPSPAPFALSARGITRRFGGLVALNDVTLEIPKRQVVSLVGPSGCGKSTFLRALTMLDPADEGVITIDGQPFGNAPGPGSRTTRQSPREFERMRAKIGLVFQQFNLWPHMTVEKNITTAQRIVLGRSAAEARARAHELLQRLHIAQLADRYPSQISGGQKQRVAIARAMSMDPTLMLFDEPTSALDPEMIGEVLQLLRDIAAEGTTMLVVTHEIAFARNVADRMVFMDRGEIVADGDPRQIITSHDNPRIRQFFNKISHAHA
ncbi:amino acid ABC transporter ATP-binding protein [Ancylobacter sp. Lp-2]|uniref:amino acid ABC transporter ATP-binding protein n=1 Tax=Ancylobacter sp. Lp-2 TaxID=2881339 RepID=UPI001E5A368C|nr:amino acid ABC transporter ATP-binding protein [Ancylobacter sp. Lp-2]MCB4767866.1 amino acid ABC transporter ATP-binding protein [Ancylobacter sp. Lp-2]